VSGRWRGDAAERCAGHLQGDSRGAAEGWDYLFSYLNPVLQVGLEAFAKAAKAAGADGVLLTDMIVEEADEYLR
jgi:tryptophan synthase alpha subunit